MPLGIGVLAAAGYVCYKIVTILRAGGGGGFGGASKPRVDIEMGVKGGKKAGKPTVTAEVRARVRVALLLAIVHRQGRGVRAGGFTFGHEQGTVGLPSDAILCLTPGIPCPLLLYRQQVAAATFSTRFLLGGRRRMRAPLRAARQGPTAWRVGEARRAQAVQRAGRSGQPGGRWTRIRKRARMRRGRSRAVSRRRAARRR